MLQRIQFFDKKDPKLSLSELLSWMTIFKSIHMAFYVSSSWACALFRNNKQHVVLGKKKVSTRARKWTLTDSERKMNRSEVSSKWNKCRIYVGDQLDRWNELKEVLHVQTRTEFANILLDRSAEHVFSFFSQSFFIFYEFMMMPMIIFGRYYSIYVILHLATANYCQWIA